MKTPPVKARLKSKMPAVQAPPPEEWGPAMKSLNEKQQRFAIAFWTSDHATDAARTAGYEDNGTGALKVTAYRMSHNPKILAAIKELGQAGLSGEGVKLGARVLVEIASNPQHPKQFDAAKLLLGIGGISAAIEHKHEVKVEITIEQKVQRLRQLADILGKPPEELLGAVELSPDEYEVVNG